MRTRYFILMIVGMLGLLLAGRWLLSPGGPLSFSLADSTTERDFKTDAERVAFIQRYLPTTIPAGASEIRFEYVCFQDYHLNASFRLPPAADLASFIKVLNTEADRGLRVETKNTTSPVPAVTTQPDGTFHFVTRDGWDTGTIRIDSDTGKVVMECFCM